MTTKAAEARVLMEALRREDILQIYVAALDLGDKTTLRKLKPMVADEPELAAAIKSTHRQYKDAIYVIDEVYPAKVQCH